MPEVNARRASVFKALNGPIAIASSAIFPAGVFVLLYFWRPVINSSAAIDVKADWRDLFSVLANASATVWAIIFIVTALLNVRIPPDAGNVVRQVLLLSAKNYLLSALSVLSPYFLLPLIFGLLGLVPKITGSTVSFVVGIICLPLIIFLFLTINAFRKVVLQQSSDVDKIANALEIAVAQRARLVDELLPHLPATAEAGRPTTNELLYAIPLKPFSAPESLRKRIAAHNSTLEKIVAESGTGGRSFDSLSPLIDHLIRSPLQGNGGRMLSSIPWAAIILIECRPLVGALAAEAMLLLIVGLVLCLWIFVSITTANWMTIALRRI